MKTKQSFVTNSSSTSFIIKNKTKEVKTIVDFVIENPQLVEEYRKQYSWSKDDPEYTQERLIESAQEEVGDNNRYTLYPGENCCIFGDEQGTLIGVVFDYILRDGGESESFIWRFDEYHR